MGTVGGFGGVLVGRFICGVRVQAWGLECLSFELGVRF